MKTLVLSLVLLTASLTTIAQKEVRLEELPKLTGDSVITGGKVYETKVVNGGKLLHIYVGGLSPKQQLTIVINKEIQAILAEPLKKQLLQIKVAGKVESFQNKPQIIIRDPSQIHSIITETGDPEK